MADPRDLSGLGGRLDGDFRGEAPDGDLLRQVLIDHGSAAGRSSWDPMLILLAAAGDPEKAGYRCVYGTASVDPESGRNYFRQASDGSHCYVVKLRPDAWYAAEIDRRL